jgi:sporulation-control protein spo0M
MTDEGRSTITITLPEPIALPDGSGGAITMPAGVFAPGTSFTATVEAINPDSKARGIRVELGYVNTYQTYDRDSDGHRYKKTTTSWVRASLVRLPLERGRRPVRFEIPLHFPPTVPGMVDWRIRAVLDRERGFDKTAEISIIVLTHRGMYSDQPLAAPVLAPGIHLWLETHQVLHLHRGDVLRGKVMARPQRSVKLRGIRLDLVQVTESREVREQHTSATIPLCGPMHTEVGQQWTMPFELLLSGSLPPTGVAAYSTLSYQLDIVADIPMAIDEVTHVPITLT